VGLAAVSDRLSPTRAPPVWVRVGFEPPGHWRWRCPAGSKPASGFTFPGSGEVGHGGGPSGDLYLEFTVTQHPTFQRIGRRPGGDHRCRHVGRHSWHHGHPGSIDGPVDVEIRPGVQNDDTLTFKSRGVTKLRGPVGVILPSTFTSLHPRNLAKRNQT
jgi:DnaJ-class molecular chaperone